MISLPRGRYIKHNMMNYKKRINELERENKDYKKKLYSCCNDDSMAYLDPHEMHKMIRMWENKYKIW